MNRQPSLEPTPYRLSVADYHRMADVGIFAPEARVELIDGAIFTMAPIGQDHASIVNRLNHLCVHAVDHRAIVQVQGPLQLSDISELQPDIVILRYRDDFYGQGGSKPTPEDVLLLMEVADSSLRYDSIVKHRMYATHGVPVYCLMDVAAGALTVCRQPADNSYRETKVMTAADASPLSFGDGFVVDFASLF